jgi:3-hydroxyisobutyrate dehydrogenase
MKTREIAWVGTGVMGASMVSRVIDAGHNVTVHNRSRVKAERALAKGATWAESPGAAASDAEVVFTIVGYPADVREVYFGDSGILAHASPGAILIDMTTTRPSLALDIYESAKEKGLHSIDAPVSGGDVGARDGTLSIMVGGDDEDVQAVRPLFEILGRTITHVGGPGAGQHTKMCNQITIAGTMIGVCEALIYGHKAGLDLNIMLAAISGGAAGCWTLDNLAPRIVNRNLGPGFYVDHFVKDMEIALDEARRMDLALPGLALVHQLYKALQAQGHGRLGTHALTLALEAMNDER